MTSKKRKNRRKQLLKKSKDIQYKPAKKDIKGKLLKYYTNNYKKLMLIPISILLISLLILFTNFIQTGEFINKGVSIKGGISVTILSDTLEKSDVRMFFENEFPDSDIKSSTISSTGKQVGIIIEASDISQDELIEAIKTKYNLNSDEYTLEVTGSSLGQSFYKQMIIAIIIAYLFMGFAVYLYFRTLIPSLAVILAAFSNMIITLAFVSLINLKITTAGIAAFLMLIGYSVDTDILLTTKVLKRKEGTVMTRVLSALDTGITMNITTIIAISAALIISESEVIKQIMIILLVGLFADIINTWIQNVGLLRLYLEKKGIK